MPLEFGNYWKYLVYDNFQNILKDSIRFRISKNWSIQKESDGSWLYGAQMISEGEPDPTGANLVYSDERGYGQAGVIADNDTLIVDRVNWPFPVTIGADTFTYRFAWNNDHYVVADSIQTFVLSTNEEIETPVGTFNTIVYRRIIPPDEIAGTAEAWSDAHIVPGIGQVAFVIRTSLDGSAKFSYLLSEYCLNQPATE